MANNREYESLEDKIHRLNDKLVEMERGSPKEFIRQWIKGLSNGEYGCPMMMDTIRNNFECDDIPDYDKKASLYGKICEIMEEDDSIEALEEFNKYDTYLLEKLEEMYKDEYP